MSRHRVLIVEDDLALGEFYCMALEGLPVEPELCHSAEAALEALLARQADVVIVDLILPGLSGRDLLRRVHGDASLRGSARLVAMSGHVDGEIRREMQSLGAWRVLHKPFSMAAFRSCVEGILGLFAEGPSQDSTGDSAAPPHARPGAEAGGFAADEAVLDAFRAACLQQFERDKARGNRAVAARDLADLHRLAHDLRGVLLTLGQPGAAGLAGTLEDMAARGLGAGLVWCEPGSVPPPLSPDIERAWHALSQALPGPSH